MIQIDVKSTENVVNFPKNQNLTGDLVLTLHSELTQNTYTFNVVDEGNSKRFYKFTLDLSTVENGEYNYSINDVETGLIRVGAIELSTPSIITYNEDVSVIQYSDDMSSNFRLQNKEVEYVDNGQYLVTADTGYYGLKNVVVDVNIPVDEYYANGYASGVTDGYVSGVTDGFNSGYTSGETDGIIEQKNKLSAITITNNGEYTRADGYSAITVNVPTGSTINNQNKNVSITANTAMTVTFDNGYTGLGNVGIDVNVPQTGHTDQELEEKYQSGYTAGYNSGKIVGYNSGYTAGYSEGFADGYASGQTISGISYHQLTVNITSNDASGLIGNAVITVTTSEGTQKKTYNGASLIFSILPGLNYTVSYGSVENYDAPSSATGSTTWGGSGSVTGYYEYTVSPSGYTDQYFTIEVVSGGTLKYYGNGLRTGEYSLNDGAWTEFSYSTSAAGLALNVGDKVRFRGSIYPAGNGRFLSNSGLKVNVYGNIMSLAYGSDFATATTISTSSAFSGLFNQSSNKLDIISSMNLVLPATTLAGGCYQYMFKNCSNMVDVPELPATTLNSVCYSSMFYGCTSLTTAPNLPATVAEYHCYDAMFKNCTSLVNAPVISITSFNGSGSMQSMFEGCTSLTTAPDLLAEDIYDSTTYNCMFSKCTSLNYIKCLGKYGNQATEQTSMTYNVAATGTFVKRAGVNWASGSNGIPTGWTVIEA